MTARLALISMFLTSFLVLTGCGDRKEKVVIYKERPVDRYDDDRDYDEDDYEDVSVHVEHRHICTRNCLDHYYNGSRVIVLRSHRHHPGCGHLWNGSYWVVAARRGHPRAAVRVPARHVCTRACNHYWNGSRIIDVQGHRHGPGCGHDWNGTYWIAARAHRGTVVVPKRRGHHASRHVCTRACNHFWNGSRIIDVQGHRHGAGCGHAWNGTYWVVASTRGGTTVIPKGGRRIR